MHLKVRVWRSKAEDRVSPENSSYRGQQKYWDHVNNDFTLVHCLKAWKFYNINDHEKLMQPFECQTYAKNAERSEHVNGDLE